MPDPIPQSDVLQFVIVSLAAARLTRVAVLDQIGEWLRLWAGRWSWAWDLVTCPWCIGFWISLAVVAVWWWQPTSPWFWLPAHAFAISHIVGLVHSFDSALHPDDE